MCTVTVLSRAQLRTPVPAADSLLLRVACNRDERLTRDAAAAPSVHVLGQRRVVMPVDPESGGTWIAASDAGLVFALLNATTGPSPAIAGDSRGSIIPRLLASSTVSEALGLALGGHFERYRPFRLMVMDPYQLVECWLDEGRVRHRRAYLQGAVMRTSSGLGDALVEGPRRALFRQFFKGPGNAVVAQDAFHDHQWPGREAVSVRMSRGDARTVSRCIVELSAGYATMTYRATGAREVARAIVPLAGAPSLAAARRCS
jgi:hypothetical protein